MTTRVFVELDGDLRRRLEAVVESLIDLLDQLDGDAEQEAEDLEDGDDDEPDDAATITRIY